MSADANRYRRREVFSPSLGSIILVQWQATHSYHHKVQFTASEFGSEACDLTVVEATCGRTLCMPACTSRCSEERQIFCIEWYSLRDECNDGSSILTRLGSFHDVAEKETEQLTRRASGCYEPVLSYNIIYSLISFIIYYIYYLV
jgi:hypothetical protein